MLAGLGENLNLSMLPKEVEKAKIRQAFLAIDLHQLNAELGPEGRPAWPELIYANREILKNAGLYELHLLHALVYCTSTPEPENDHLDDLIAYANHKALRGLGDPLPSTEPHTLYRGCSGVVTERKVRGYFWTSKLGTAQRYACFRHRSDPAVYKIQVESDAILVYHSMWHPEEYIVRVPSHIEPLWVWPEHTEP